MVEWCQSSTPEGGEMDDSVKLPAKEIPVAPGGHFVALVALSTQPFRPSSSIAWHEILGGGWRQSYIIPPIGFRCLWRSAQGCCWSAPSPEKRLDNSGLLPYQYLSSVGSTCAIMFSLFASATGCGTSAPSPTLDWMYSTPLSRAVAACHSRSGTSRRQTRWKLSDMQAAAWHAVISCAGDKSQSAKDQTRACFDWCGRAPERPSSDPVRQRRGVGQTNP
ncbi:hypothetical protein LZ30DRAFT_684235 [Colletotrichum cereale]|nr:hypothetical protein LZ30DRAFT_684235 [Colletotrichum cereale]